MLQASAPNRRKWGKFHHLLNAKAIFVIAKTGIEADGYATAGFKEGIELSKKLPVEMLLISSENKMYQSKGVEAKIFT